MRAFRSLSADWNSGRAVFAQPISDNSNIFILSADQPKYIDIPVGANFVSFTMSSDLWARYFEANVEQSFPEVTSDLTDGTAPDLNPTIRIIPDNVKTIGVMSDLDACICNIQFFA